MARWYAAAALMVSVLSFSGIEALGETNELHSFLKEHQPANIYVDLKNTSGDDKVDVKILKKMLEDNFSARKAYTFKVVESADGADLILKADVMEYIWMAEDPVDQVWGIGQAALDAVNIENYARIQVDTSLVDAKHARTLWSDRVKATMTQKVMQKDASYGLIYPKFIKSVMIEIFKKRTA